MNAEGAELAAMEKRLRDLVVFRDALADELARIEREIAKDSRAYATARGDLAKPTLPQLRRQLFPEEDNLRRLTTGP